MKLKTSINILGGCLIIFLFIMLPVFLSKQDKKEEYVASFKGSNFTLKDMNNKKITQESFEGPLTMIFFGFTVSGVAGIPAFRCMFSVTKMLFHLGV